MSMASIFCGARLGTEGAQVSYKQKNKELFNFIINVKCLLFNNDINLLNDYLKDKDNSENYDAYPNKLLNPKSQLEFSF